LLQGLLQGEVVMEPGQWPQQRPLKRHESHLAEQMAERAAGLARDSHARTRHAAVLMRDDSMLGWGINGVPFPGEDHCYCKVAEFGNHDMCRTHAEQRAITLARDGDGWRMLPGAKLVYVRLEADDSVRLETPHFCPRCSRLALSLGVAEWIFALSEGLVGYSSADYDAISQLSWLPRNRGMACFVRLGYREEHACVRAVVLIIPNGGGAVRVGLARPAVPARQSR
jgi:deoxycytidylate deaminase